MGEPCAKGEPLNGWRIGLYDASSTCNCLEKRDPLFEPAMLYCGIATEKVGLEPQMFGIEASVGTLVSCSEAACPAMLINVVSISWSFAVELFTDREFGESGRC